MRERLVTEMTQRWGPLIVSSETAVTLLGGRCCANEMPPRGTPVRRELPTGTIDDTPDIVAASAFHRRG
jgi:hypothetical protein